MLNRSATALLALLLFLAAGLPAQSRYFPVDELRPGMVGVGRTVFEGDRLDEFKVHILGVLRNVIGTATQPDPGAARRRPAGQHRASSRA